MTLVDFLKDMLNKQFELANCDATVDDVIEMDETNQVEFWEKYSLTSEQYIVWKQYFIEHFPETEEYEDIKEMENCNEIVESIFETLAEEWAFNIVEIENTEIEGTN